MKKGKIDCLIGLQWGDEGKGNVISRLAPNYAAIVRPQGGANAGHTLYYKMPDGERKKFIGHLLPSGVFQPNVELWIGGQVIVDPIQLYGPKGEITELIDRFGIDVRHRLYIAQNAILQSPYDKIFDEFEEFLHSKETKVGSTKRGIGPSYGNNSTRNGLRMGDILYEDFSTKATGWFMRQRNLLKFYKTKYDFVPSISKEVFEELISFWLSTIPMLRKHVISLEARAHAFLEEGKDILAEGAQAVLLDLEFGDYPFVTSSNTKPSVVCDSLGVPHTAIRDVYGVVKPYATKVGGGFFPSRMPENIEKCFQDAGAEKGATTGRSRMCGWFDLPLFRYAMRITGVNKLVIAKSDICPAEKMYAVEQYKTPKGIIDGYSGIPHRWIDLQNPILKEFKGWGDIKPPKGDFGFFLNYFENEVCKINPEVKIFAIGTGPYTEDLVLL